MVAGFQGKHLTIISSIFFNTLKIFQCFLSRAIQVKTLTGARSKFRLSGVAFRQFRVRFPRLVANAVHNAAINQGSCQEGSSLMNCGKAGIAVAHSG
jgi:hypothetical protein